MKIKAFVSVQIIQVCLSLVLFIELEFDLSKKATLIVLSKDFKCSFRLTYFKAYIKQVLQINKFLCIIYKFLK